jgi:hypothetical protein
MTTDLHHHGGIGIGEAAFKLVFGQGAGKHGEHVVALRDRLPDRRPAAGHAGHAGDHLGRIARGKPHMEMHVRAVEQGITLGDHRDHFGLVEMRGDRSRRAVVECAQRLAIRSILLRDLGRHGIKQRQLLDSRFEVLARDSAGVARVSGLGEMGGDVGRIERGDGIQREQPGIAGTDADADETPYGHRPSLASALTAAAVMALPPIRPRTMR